MPPSVPIMLHSHAIVRSHQVISSFYITEVILNFKGLVEKIGLGAMYAFTRLVGDLPHLESLNPMSFSTLEVSLFAYHSSFFLFVSELIFLSISVSALLNGPKFTNMNQFELDGLKCGKMKIVCCRIVYILKAFPLLQKLQLNLVSYLERDLSRNFDMELNQGQVDCSPLPDCPHKHLSHLQIYGFKGFSDELKLFKYLLPNLVALKVVVVGTFKKVKVLVEHYYPTHPLSYKKQLKSAYHWFRTVLPQDVHLQTF